MATVESRLQLFDAFSRPLKNITQAMNIAISAMLHFQRTMGQNADLTRQLEAAQRLLANAEADIRRNLDGAADSQRRFNDQAARGERSTKSMMTNIKGMAAAYIGFQSVRGVLGATVGGAMEQQKMRDMLIARTDSAPVGNAMFEKFKQDALNKGMDVKESLTGILSFFSMTKNTDQIGELLSIAQRLAAFDTTGQGLSGGVFSTKEAMSGDIISLAERFNMSKAMIRQFGVDKLGKKGDIAGFIDGFNKLLDAQSMGKKAFETMLQSPIQQAEVLRNKIKSGLADAGSAAVKSLMPVIEMLNKSFDDGKFQSVLDDLSAGLRVFAEVSAWTANMIIDHWDVVKNAMLALGVVLTAIAGMWLVDWIIAAWPVFAVIAALTVLLSVLNHFGVSTQQAISFVIGSFTLLYTAIWNGIASTWNLIASFIDFLVNMWVDPDYAQKKFVYDLKKNFLDGLYHSAKAIEDFSTFFAKSINYALNLAIKGYNKLADALNNIPGFDMQQAKLIDEDNIHFASSSLKSMMDNLQMPTTDKQVALIPRMQPKDLAAGFKVGYDFTGNMLDQIKALDPSAQFADILKKWDSEGIPRVNSLGGIDDKVDISSEDLKVMRDLSEMKSIQNFVTLTPTYQITTGDLHNNVDADAFLSLVVDQVEQSMQSSVAGVIGQ